MKLLMYFESFLDSNSCSLSFSEELEHHLLSFLEAECFLQLDHYRHEPRGVFNHILPPSLSDDVAQANPLNRIPSILSFLELISGQLLSSFALDV